MFILRLSLFLLFCSNLIAVDKSPNEITETVLSMFDLLDSQNDHDGIIQLGLLAMKDESLATEVDIELLKKFDLEVSQFFQMSKEDLKMVTYLPIILAQNNEIEDQSRLITSNDFLSSSDLSDFGGNYELTQECEIHLQDKLEKK